jgi:hypothetical protein
MPWGADATGYPRPRCPITLVPSPGTIPEPRPAGGTDRYPRATRCRHISRPVGDRARLASRSPALGWLRTERANLLACLDHATHHARRPVVGLTAGVAAVLRSDGPWTQTLELHAHAAAAARRLGEANALGHLGVVRRSF